ncbi:hypothetical protein A4H97_00020 [Niastella yeongjuensis]|uniref:Uncharacterized protein n=1 Tax=Niastella yeongjuensis TaxID=354355 RepID=A0A1V9EVX2_9BACT|nr:contact-dependent growth inhibition system immunity protein [Niastella yeongjuensis]OQP50271.1 hypothetical protein A4H97_00020 [Niastella yeongjuensis]SEN41773.1 hypothetical protein SAMN05660816_00947 [Niastella yeongjuensis]
MSITKSIEQLENDYWKEFDFPTGLVERCFRYRKIPIGNLTPEQLRTLISQQIGLKYLIPLSLDILKQNILTEADLYEGDLLASILSVDPSFWGQYPAIKLDMQQLILLEKGSIEQCDDASQLRQLLKKMEVFIL